MRDNLPKRINENESGIVNMDSKSGRGTHWTAYIKKGWNILYFDSYGHLAPPPELIKYFQSNGPVHVTFNYDHLQTNSYSCGHHALNFLYKYSA